MPAKVVMTGRSIPCCLVVLLLDAFLSLPASSQSTSVDNLKTRETSLYANAHSYVDEPLPELKKTVHELAKLQPAPGDEELPGLLQKVGTTADDLLRRVPDLISDETVSQSQYTLSQGSIPGCVGSGCYLPGSNTVIDNKFNYLILSHPAKDSRQLLQEYRTGTNGKPVRQGVETPNFQGFVVAWIIFSSPNQVESRFRYLGQQQIDGHKTFVIGFRQIPGSVESPGVIVDGAESVPMLLQGIAWIDKDNFRIVRLRTDLLASIPELRMQKQTANILFSSIHISGMDSDLWLPTTVRMEMDARGQYIQEQHKYSNYRLYRSRTRIIFPPDN